jgi:hypothetical protein
MESSKSKPMQDQRHGWLKIVLMRVRFRACGEILLAILWALRFVAGKRGVMMWKEGYSL